ncbi:MAG: DUF4124 domain-containing protein [Pseudomonadales bacterium]|nr:DUF4124 domain-containing protein [Pseudomonadales bacterium]
MLALTTLLLGSSAHAEIHKWTDEDGEVHFGDRPPDGVETETVTVSVITYTSPEITPFEPFERADSRQSRVTMYSATWCGVCRKAKDYFQSNNISFVEYDVENSARGKRDYQRMGGQGVPIILVGKQRLNGFSAAAFERIYQRDNASQPLGGVKIKIHNR